MYILKNQICVVISLKVIYYNSTWAILIYNLKLKKKLLKELIK